jgi:streptomycin 6-kinase
VPELDVREALPSEVRERVQRFFGERGRAWMEALPGVVDGLLERWELSLAGGGAYGRGSHSLVVAVDRADGLRAVLKVPVQDDENRTEADALRLYAGDGAVLLHAADPATGALLLERAEPGTPLTALSDRAAAVQIACGLLRRLRRPVPADHPFTPVPALVERWGASIPADQRRHGGPMPAGVLREVLAAIEALRAPAGDPVLVNRDGHMDNMLAAQRQPWLLIDPKPLVGEPAFDGGWLLVDLLRPGPSAEAARHHAAAVGLGLGVPAERVRLWALLRSAENVMWELADGGDPSLHLALAEALC